MKAKRRSVHLVGLVALSFLIALGSARADSNSVFLINVTNNVPMAIDQYTGVGVKIGQLESSVPDTNNLLLGGAVKLTTNLFAGTSGRISSHPTEVAGTMVSTGLTTLGAAPGASLYSVGFSSAGVPGGYASDQAFLNNEMNSLWFLATNSLTGVQIINMSFGSKSVTNAGYTGGGAPINVGRLFNDIGTNAEEVAIDSFVSLSRVTVVKSAGNDGDNQSAGAGSVGGTNTISAPAGAYNIITAGAVSNVLAGTGGTNVTDFSSGGYLVNGRSAVDIVAPGQGMLMPTTNNPAAPVGPHSATASADGTSFAAPQVAAVIARLDQYESTFLNSNAATDPRTIKAVLLNSATKLPGWGQGSVVGGTAGLQGTLTGTVTQVLQPLDPFQGAGLLNANGALLQMAGGQHSPTIQQLGYVSSIHPSDPITGWDFNTVSLNLTNFYQLDERTAGTLAITLDWYRDTTAWSGAGTNNILGMANLNLNLYSSANSQYTNTPLVAQSISTVDNIQHLWFTNVPSAYYEFGVIYKGYASQGGPTPGDESYSIAWSFTPIPEPSSLLLAALGLTALWWRMGRRKT